MVVALATTGRARIDIDVRPLHGAVERSGLNQGQERPESKKYVVETHCINSVDSEFAVIVYEDG